MGCKQSKDLSIDAEPKLLYGDQEYKEQSPGLKGFSVSTADFCTEKTGRIQKDYSILHPPLGKGAFGEVRKGIHKQSKLVRAIKIIHKENATKQEQQKLINEVEDHPNILKVFEYYQDEHSIYIVTELCTGGELFDRIVEASFFNERKAAKVFRQLISAVYYCHQHNVVHRDLKPENLLLETSDENSLIKVIDFGTSMMFDPLKKMNQKFGTPYYIAPEVLKRKYDYKCDIWSSGVILYIILTGQPPFNGPSDKAIMDRVLQGKYRLDIPQFDNISHDAKDLISKMLEYDPLKRITAGEVLQHSWVKKFANEKIAQENKVLKTLDNLRTFRVIFQVINKFKGNHEIVGGNLNFFSQYHGNQTRKG